MPDLGKAFVQIVPSAEGITGAIEKLLGGEAEKAGKSAGSKIAAGIGAAAAAGSAAVVAFGVQAVQTGSAFDAAMSQVAATMGKTMADMENEVGTVDLAWGTFSGNLREYAQEMGANTAFSATQAAEALNYMALAGYDTATSMAMLPNVLSLAAAGSMDLARASDMITDTQTAFGISLERTTQLVDEMAKAASTGNTSVEQLGDAFLTVGGLAAELNGGIVYLADGTEVATDGVQELEIALTAMANAGVKGSEAGAHMRNMILKLVSPTNAGAAAMEALNLDVFDAQGNMNSLSSIMEQLAIGMHDLSQEQKLIYISDLFNARDVASAEALLGAIEQDWDKIGASILEAQGAAQTMADTQLNNLAGDVTLLKSAFEGVQIAVSDQLTPSLREFATFGQEALSSIGAAIQEGGLMAGIQELGNQLAGAATMILERLPEIADAGLQLVTSLVTSILEYLGTHTEEVVTAGVQLLGSLLNSTTEIVEAIVKNLPGIITGLVNALTSEKNLDTIFTGGIELFKALVSNIPQIVDALTSGLIDLVMGIGDYFTDPENSGAIVDAGIELLGALVSMPFKIVENMYNNIRQIVTELKGSLTGEENMAEMFDVGLAFARKVIAGLTLGLSEIPLVLNDRITEKNMQALTGEFSKEVIDPALADIQAGKLGSETFRDDFALAASMHDFDVDLQRAMGGETTIYQYNNFDKLESVEQLNELAQNARRFERMSNG